MTAEQKIKKIVAELVGINPLDMTEMELRIRDIVEEKKATVEERECAGKNTATLGMYP